MELRGTLYGVYIFLNFGFRLKCFASKDTKTQFYVSKVA